MKRTSTDLKMETVRQWISSSDPAGILKIKNHFDPDNLLNDDSGQGVLLTSLPVQSFSRTLIEQLAWFPAGIPAGTSTLIASSRIGNQPDTKPYIFDAIRTLCPRFVRDNKFLISHDGIATNAFVKRAANIFGTAFLEFRPFPKTLNSSWFEFVLNQQEDCFVAHYHPNWQTEITTAPDELLIGACREAYLLSVRSNGNISKSVQRRLNSNDELKFTFLLTESPDTTKGTACSLIEAGAIAWHLYQTTIEKPNASTPGKHRKLNEFKQQHQLGDYLVHWTRRRNGPWPNQTQNQFVDNLILGLSASDHSKIATLIRIVATQTLLATNSITRDSTPVVSFTENRADQLAKLRKFRPHLSRWDFETVGIAIRRDVLQNHGARPVKYGTDQNFDKLSSNDRPFFQMEGTTIDWRNELEWRIPGNLNLNRIGTGDAFLFVDRAPDADKIAAVSKWPVVLIDGE